MLFFFLDLPVEVPLCPLALVPLWQMLDLLLCVTTAIFQFDFHFYNCCRETNLVTGLKQYAKVVFSPAFSVLFWMFSFKYPSTDSSCYNYIQSWQSLTERWIYNLKPYVVWKKMTSILSLPLLVWRDAFTSGNGEVFNWKETLLTLQLMTIHTKLRSVWSRGWCFLSVQAWSE